MAAQLSLTQRDVDIVLMAWSYAPGCTIDLLKRRFFPTPGARSACYARVAMLCQAGYLTSHRLPSLDGIGSGKSLLALGPQGRILVSDALGVPRSEIGRQIRAVSPFVLAHHAALSSLRLSVELAADRTQMIGLDEWVGEVELRRSPIQIVTARVTCDMVPDGCFTLELSGGNKQKFFVEMDMGTIVSPRRFKPRLAAYMAYATQQSPSPVLIVVPNKSRQAVLTRWAGEEAKVQNADPTIFLTTTLDQVNERTVFQSPIWQVVGGPDCFALAPNHREQPVRPPMRVMGQLLFAREAVS